MIQLLKVLWNILLRKSDQSALPNSIFLLFVVFLLYFLSQSISGFTVSETPLIFVRSFFVDVILMIVFLRILTQIFSTQDDFNRTLIALFGTGALFNIIASPLIIRFADILNNNDLIDSTDIPLWLPLIFFIIAIWSIMVMGHIFSRSMIKDNSSSSPPPISGVAIALLYMMINFLVHSSFLGE